MAKRNPQEVTIGQAAEALDAEQAVLGAVMISTTAVKTALEMLKPDDFYLEAHRLIFAVVSDLAGLREPADLITVSAELKRREQLDACSGLSYLNQLLEAVPTAAHIEHYARLVREASVKRDLADGLTEAAVASRNGRTSGDVLAAVEKLAAHQRGRQSHSLPATIGAAELLSLELPPPRWAVPGILPEGLVILAGKPKTGKSWLALEILIAVASGGIALGRIPAEQGRCLYLALEDTKIRLQDRLRFLLGDAPCPPELHLTTEWPRSEEGGRSALLEWFRKHPDTRLIVVDTFTRFRSPRGRNGNVYEEDYAAIASVKTVADRHGATVLVIHHQRKMAADDPLDSVSGSLGLTGAADGILIVKRERGQADASLYVTGRDVEENDLALRWDDRTAWAIMGSAADFRQSQEQAEIIAALKALGGGASPAEVAERLEKPRNGVKQRLYRLWEKGVLRVTDGVYYLIPKEDSGESVSKGVTAVTAVTAGEIGNKCGPSSGENGSDFVPGDTALVNCDQSIARSETPEVVHVTAVTAGEIGNNFPSEENCDQSIARLQRLQQPQDGSGPLDSSVTNSEPCVSRHENESQGPGIGPELLPNYPAVTPVTPVTPLVAPARAHERETVRDLARRAFYPEVSLPDGTRIEGLYQAWEDFAEGAKPRQLTAAIKRLRSVVDEGNG